MGARYDLLRASEAGAFEEAWDHLEWPTGGGKGRKKMKRADVERIMGKEWLEEGRGVLTWRDKNRKNVAYSIE
jgi:hypothetical protein